MLVIILLAMVAAFLALRLYSVLGKRTGHEQQPLPRAAEDHPPIASVPRPVELSGEPRGMTSRLFDPAAEAGVRALIAADPGFDVTQFVDGAKSAYRMILEAFWAGDRETLGWLAEPQVRDAFVEAIDAREAAGETLDNRLIAIERAIVAEASVDNNIARVAVRFDADIAAVTRDRDGNVIAGSLSDAVETHETWTFTRPLRSGDPDWKLSDTDDA